MAVPRDPDWCLKVRMNPLLLNGPRTGRKWQGQEVEVEETVTGREDGIESLVYPKPQREPFVKVLVFGVAVQILTTLGLWCDCI